MHPWPLPELPDHGRQDGSEVITYRLGLRKRFQGEKAGEKQELFSDWSSVTGRPDHSLQKQTTQEQSHPIYTFPQQAGPHPFRHRTSPPCCPGFAWSLPLPPPPEQPIPPRQPGTFQVPVLKVPWPGKVPRTLQTGTGGPDSAQLCAPHRGSCCTGGSLWAP